MLFKIYFLEVLYIIIFLVVVPSFVEVNNTYEYYIYWSIYLIAIIGTNHMTNMYVTIVLLTAHLLRLLNRRIKKCTQILENLEHEMSVKSFRIKIQKIMADEFDNLSIIHFEVTQNIQNILKICEFVMLLILTNYFIILIAEVR